MKSDKYITSHALVHRCYDMLKYLGKFEGQDMKKHQIKNQIRNNLKSIETVETYAQYFYLKLKRNKNKVELRCNLKDLVNDLNYLKQYLEKETAESRFFNEEKEEIN